jgi:hypothetical protein
VVSTADTAAPQRLSEPLAHQPAPDAVAGEPDQLSMPPAPPPPAPAGKPTVRGGGAPPPKRDIPIRQRGSDVEVIDDESWRHNPATSADWFVPKDPVSPEVWAERRDSAQVKTVFTAVADVRTDSTPTTINSAHGLISYDLRRIQVAPAKFVQVYRLKIYLRAGENVDAATIAAVQARATAGVDEMLNQGFRLPSGDQFHVDVEFTNNAKDAHTTIGVDTGIDTDQTHWNPDTSAGVLAHETLHYLGVPDESLDTRRVFLQHATNSGVHQGDGTMMDQDGVGDKAGVRPRHLWLIERSANSQVTVADTLLGDRSKDKREPLRPQAINTDTPVSDTRPAPKHNRDNPFSNADRRGASQPPAPADADDATRSSRSLELLSRCGRCGRCRRCRRCRSLGRRSLGLLSRCVRLFRRGTELPVRTGVDCFCRPRRCQRRRSEAQPVARALVVHPTVRLVTVRYQSARVSEACRGVLPDLSRRPGCRYRRTRGRGRQVPIAPSAARAKVLTIVGRSSVVSRTSPRGRLRDWVVLMRLRQRPRIWTRLVQRCPMSPGMTARLSPDRQGGTAR